VVFEGQKASPLEACAKALSVLEMSRTSEDREAITVHSVMAMTWQGKTRLSQTVNHPSPIARLLR
jgi:hypothetical protein